nr:RHS repeat-associated core domain-containing protein [Kibdelosporangium sp. MJ126-NF4]CEL19903.1 FIG01288243: hypothetical protein [Kibdelosporangium sp. MJ126-NF4]CTQ97127.1 FIG01288243: hypothetical protein [Kibdelosporangium sp. MJ126-NF4]
MINPPAGLRKRRTSAIVTAVALAAGMVADVGYIIATDLGGQPDVRLEATPVEPRVAPPARGPELVGHQQVAWPVAASAEVEPVAQARQAGNLPVSVRKPATAHAPAKVKVEVLDRAATERAGVQGMVFTVRPVDGQPDGQVGVDIDYQGFRGAFGGDYGARLRIVDMPECVLSTPDKPECRTGDVVPTSNEVTASRLTADVPVRPGRLMAVSAGPSSGNGDFKATSLSPSSTWQVSTQSGDFTTTYPMPVPPVPGGLVPDLTATYSTNAVDGHTASTNNQPSWVGEGWDLWPGSIERRYKTCATDTASGNPNTGDLCWGQDNASFSLGSRSGEIVMGANGWRLTGDDGTIIKRLTGVGNGDDNGEYWQAITPDGTQYFYGAEPDSQSTWTAPVRGKDPTGACTKEYCPQGWRWNLDKVVDRHGNVMRYFYEKENNSYGYNMGATKVEYTRGGTLRRIEYGVRGDVSGKAAARVLLDTADRCVPNTDCSVKKPEQWPDVPWDQECTTGTCSDKRSPSFWSTKRLSTVTTQVLGQNNEYSNVDKWTLGQTYPAPPDKTSPGLWLRSMKREGLVGTAVASTPTVFEERMLPNRVNTDTDGLLPLDKPRISGIRNESGGHVMINYLGHDCDTKPATKYDNKQRCFPVKWVPEQSGPVDDWFARYIVTSTVQQDLVGATADQKTFYEYPEAPAWVYNDDPLIPEKSRTWSNWRGYGRVIERTGGDNETQSEKETRYFRGLHGTRLNEQGGTRTDQVTDSRGGKLDDKRPLAGTTRETIARNGKSGAVLSSEIADPWLRGPTTSGGGREAYMVKTEKTITRTAMPGVDKWRTVESKSTIDDYGNVSQQDDAGDTAVTGDEKCVRTTFANNVSANFVGSQSRVETVSVPCSAKPNYPADVISDVRTYFDDKDLAVAPTRGLVTRVESLSDYRDGKPVYSDTARSVYDRYGRILESTDALGAKTTTAYTPQTGLPVSGVVSNSRGFSTTTTYASAWDKPLAIVDQNNRKMSVTYDGLGRVTGVWSPGRSKDANEGPSRRYAYQVRTDGASSVQTETVKANGNYVSTYALFDGFLRPRQTQAPAWGGGRVVTDTYYDSRGLVSKSNDAYSATSDPGPGLIKVDDDLVPAQTRSVFDGAARSTRQVKLSKGKERWVTTTDYVGDEVRTATPVGGTAQTKVLDAQGKVKELRQHRGNTLTAAYDTTKYSYTPDGQRKTITDPAGNIWKYAYDVRGRERERTDPDAGTTTSTYDNAGNVRTKTDARGKTIVYRYDELGRKIEERLDSDTGDLLTSWTYDTAPGGKGLEASSTRYSGQNKYVEEVTGYDASGQATGSTVTIPDSETGLKGKYTTRKTYKVDGSPDTVTMPKMGDLKEETLNYFYDDLGLPSGTKGLANYVVSTNYTAFGEPSQYRFGDQSATSLWHSIYYDDMTRRVTRSLVTRNKADGVVVQNTDYTHDDAGNVLRIADRMGGETTADVQCFGYDGQRRMTDVWTTTAATCGTAGSSVGGPYGYWNTYTHDNAGNRRSVNEHGLSGAVDKVSTYTYPEPGKPKPHALQSVVTGTKTDSYSYGEIGQTTNRPGETLDWNAEGDVESVTVGATKTKHLYTAAGTLLVSRNDSEATVYIGNTWMRVDSAGNVTATRYYDQAGSNFAARSSGGLVYLFADQHGTDSLAVSATNLAVTKRRFDPFGKPRESKSPVWPTARGFVGGAEQSTSSSTRIGARNYDANTGRFMSVDPLLDSKDPQTFTAYGYARNSPATFSDPDGKSIPECREDWTICANIGVNPVTGGDPTPAQREMQKKSLERHGYPTDGSCISSCRDDPRRRAPRGTPTKSDGSPVRPSECGRYAGSCQYFTAADFKADQERRKAAGDWALAVLKEANRIDGLHALQLSNFAYVASADCFSASMAAGPGGGAQVCDWDDGTQTVTVKAGGGIGNSFGPKVAWKFQSKSWEPQDNSSFSSYMEVGAKAFGVGGSISKSQTLGDRSVTVSGGLSIPFGAEEMNPEARRAAGKFNFEGKMEFGASYTHKVEKPDGSWHLR